MIGGLVCQESFKGEPSKPGRSWVIQQQSPRKKLYAFTTAHSSFTNLLGSGSKYLLITTKESCFWIERAFLPIYCIRNFYSTLGIRHQRILVKRWHHWSVFFPSFKYVFKTDRWILNQLFNKQNQEFPFLHHFSCRNSKSLSLAGNVTVDIPSKVARVLCDDDADV